MNPSVVGIDLGTTFSLAAYMRDGKPVWFKIAELTKLVDELEKTLNRGVTELSGC